MARQPSASQGTALGTSGHRPSDGKSAPPISGARLFARMLAVVEVRPWVCRTHPALPVEGLWLTLAYYAFFFALLISAASTVGVAAPRVPVLDNDRESGLRLC